MANSKRSIELPDNGSEVVIIRGGVKVAFNSSGDVIVHMNGDVVEIRAAANDDAGSQGKAARYVKIGDSMEDGTIYAGISPDTDKPVYTTPTDAPLRMQWREAMEYAAALETHGHKDWRLPTKAELNVLFNNRAAIGGFERGSYWSSCEYARGAWIQRFSDGAQATDCKTQYSLVTCVR